MSEAEDSYTHVHTLRVLGTLFGLTGIYIHVTAAEYRFGIYELYELRALGVRLGFSPGTLSIWSMERTTLAGP